MKKLENFTNLYELSKTLKFELRPIGNTQKMLEENKVFEKDELVAKNYQEAKKWFDVLHREFINDALQKTEIKLELLQNFKESYFDYKQDKTSAKKRNLEEQAKKIRQDIIFNFEKVAEEWRDNYVAKIKDTKKKNKIKNLKKLELLFKVEVFDFLRQRYPEAVIDEKSIFDSFNKFSTYFTGFHETRKNFYKDDGTSTAIPTRIVNENLPKFLDNVKTYQNKYRGKNEDLFTKKEKEVFELKFFNKCLNQKQIDEYNDIVAGLRSKINQKRQIAENKNDFPFFKTLFKQILEEESKKEIESSDFIEITEDKEVFKVLQNFIDENQSYLPKAEKIFFDFIKDQKQETGIFDISKIYVAGRFINQISNKWFSDWSTIRSLFVEKGKKKLPEFISLEDLKEKFNNIEIEKKDLFRESFKDIYENEGDNYQIFLKIWEEEFNSNLEEYKNALSGTEELLNSEEEYKNRKDSEHKEVIRNYCEKSLSVYQMIKYFSLEKGKDKLWNPDELEEDPAFYEIFNEYYQNVHTWQYFNEFRNYLTKKPYSQDKIKLNFDDGTLLDGWDVNKEKDNLGVILKKNGKFFLGIMNKNANDIFSEKYSTEKQKNIANGSYGKMVYKLMADPKRDFPKGIFSKKGIENYKPNQEILNIYNTGSFKVDSPNFSVSNLHKIIDFFKECIPKHPSWSLFNFSHVKPTHKYQNNIGEFYNDLIKNTWRVWFEYVSEKYIEEKNEQGELYLFEIHNKDFNPKAEGRKNLHTLYWEEVFFERNQENPIIKLNGQAEIFFRKKSIEREFECRTNKKDSHEIVNKKRYTEDKIFFHCPLTLNFARDEITKDKNIYKGSADAFSVKVREYLSDNPDVNIIGIDRGEKHLAYYSVVDQKGNILEIDSFNKINGIDYHKKLDDLEKGRDQARKTWQEINKIKEMKQGYISQVVKKICDLMVEYNAIVVFEDLNSGFKRGRFAIEKQIYQNLELALAKKLNYLVFKNREGDKEGGYVKAFQFTPQIDNFKDIYKQCGFMFYIPASYTSAICPVCGFRKNIPTQIGNKNKNKEYVEKINIDYEKENNRFMLSYKLSDIQGGSQKIKLKNNNFNLFSDKTQKDEYVFYSDVSRLQFQRNKSNRGGEMRWRDPNKNLLEIFKENKIDLDDDVNRQIKSGEFENDKFYKPLIHSIRLILQLRNAVVKKDKDKNEIPEESHDFIECPACHFHSESNLKGLDFKYKGKDEFKFNGDANGAYNIARKGGLILKKISQFKDKYKDLSKMGSQDLIIKQEEWDKFAQED
ncbi:MAG: type V CRISPR-associated protein Cas12a/Cpf1 [Candidatus Muiribacteriota bacterium]